MRTSVCVWCNDFCQVPDEYNDLQHKACCSQSCKDAEQLFCLHFSDENIKNRAIWERLKNEQGKK